MIKLTENIIAVEAPEDATGIELNTECYNNKSILSGYLPKNGTFIKDLPKEAIFIGVTPLSYDIWFIRVFPDKYKAGDICSPCDLAYFLESKGLFQGKKYAIIKISGK